MVSGVGLDKLKDSGSPSLTVAKEWEPTVTTVLVVNTRCMPDAAEGQVGSELRCSCLAYSIIGPFGQIYGCSLSSSP